MKNKTRHFGTLTLVERMPDSTNGNPRYRCMCGSAVFVTQVDSTHGYSIPNDFGKECEVVVGTHHGRATLDAYRVKED